jgi:chemotaxis protein methyltransferase CheR
VKEEDFLLLSRLLKDRSGLALTRDKEYLLQSRLVPVAQKHGLGTLDALCGALRAKSTAALERDVVEAMTTNESFFFRDVTPFKAFREQVLPVLLSRRQPGRAIRIWSAACSSGQEPYSLAMILEEERAALRERPVEIVATDISTEMVERASAGTYSHFEVQRGLPIQLLTKYFKRDEERWTIVPELRRRVTFRQFNLLHDFGTLGAFDVIFCRNVLIYFDAPSKAAILAKMSRILAADGSLFLGGAETVLGVTDCFVPQPGSRGIYVHPDPAVPQLRAAS